MSPSTSASSRWVLHPKHDPEAADRLARAKELKLAMAHVLVNRGVRNPEAATAFLSPNEEHLHTPSDMLGLERAAERIRTAIERGERIFIQGDYDVDGITSTFLLYRVLKSELGADVVHRIPNRLTDGYGLSNVAVDQAHEKGCRLIVTVDCGITANEAVDYARGLGIDVVVTDHHEPPAVLPQAYAIVNPLQPGCAYPFKHLAGVGVTFKLVQQLLSAPQQELRLALESDGEDPQLGRAKQYLDVVALGTIADVVPLVGENRVLARLGLDQLNMATRPGLHALLEESPKRLSAAKGGPTKPLSSTHVAFVLAPRINAAGRMGKAERGLDLLLAEDRDEARRIARELEMLNADRRERDTLVREQASQRADRELSENPGQRSLVLADEGWHQGVIGIVASRLVERVHKPTVLISLHDGIGRGSGRSIPGVDLTRILQGCDDLLIAHGGHAFAAGLTVAIDQLPAFRERFERLVQEALASEDFVPRIAYEAEVDPAECDLELVEALDQLAPFGLDNPEPIFRMNDVRILHAKEVGQGKHIRFDVACAGREERGHTLEAIGFGLAEHLDLESLRPSARADLLVVPTLNEFMGRSRVQLKVRAVQIL